MKKEFFLSSSLRHEVRQSVNDIARSDWDQLFGDQIEGYDYYRVLESSKLEGFSFAYILVYADVRLELIAPVFWSKFDLAIGVEGIVGRFVNFSRKFMSNFLKERTLFCGSPFGESGVLGLAPDAANPYALMSHLATAMTELCRTKRLRFILFKDFPLTTTKQFTPLRALGFMKGASFPNVVVSLPFSDMEGYLASLGAGTRKGLKRKIRKAQAGQLEISVVDNVRELIDEIYTLYLKTYNAGTVRFEKLTKEYFLGVSEKMPVRTKYFLFYFEGRLICFNLCFLLGDQLIDKFIGMDHSAARGFNLYDFTWYHNVQWCLKHEVRHYQVGQTDYADKLRLGGKLVPLFYYAKHTNPLLNWLLRALATWISPVTPVTSDVETAGPSDSKLPQSPNKIT